MASLPPSSTIENDHVPLAFLLGARAKHYAPKAATRQTESHRSTHRAPAAARSRNNNNSSNSDAVQHAALFAPETHPRVREAEAQRVLREALAARNDGSNSASPTAMRSIGTLLSPMELLRDSKDQVVRHVVELQTLALDDAARNSSSTEDVHAQQQRVVNGDDRMRAASGHGLARTDSVAAFLDIAGRATHIAALSTREAKQRHRRVIKQQSDMRARRVDAMQTLLHDQQQHAQHVLQTAAAAPLAPAHHVARVDLGECAELLASSDVRSNDPVGHTSSSEHLSRPTLAAVREQLEREQQRTHERVQETRQLERLTREQTLAFHQQLKRTAAGRAKGVRRPSFLATLQLDSAAIASEADGASAATVKTEAPANALAPVVASSSSGDGRTKPRRNGRGACRNQDEDDDRDCGSSGNRMSDELLLRRQQRDAFLQSGGGGGLHLGGGGLHLGGGFQVSTTSQSTSSRCNVTADTVAVANDHIALPRYELLAGVTVHSVALSMTKKQDFERSRHRTGASSDRRKRAS